MQRDRKFPLEMKFPIYTFSLILYSMEESIDMALSKYKIHPSIATIQNKYKFSRKFEFNNVDLLKIMN